MMTHTLLITNHPLGSYASGGVQAIRALAQRISNTERVTVASPDTSTGWSSIDRKTTIDRYALPVGRSRFF